MMNSHAATLSLVGLILHYFCPTFLLYFKVCCILDLLLFTLGKYLWGKSKGIL